MRRDKVNVPADVRRLLGDNVLDDVLDQFHPGGECRICGKPLGVIGRFSLWVNQINMMAVAVPFHAPCMASAANHPDYLGVPAGTFQTLPVGIPLMDSAGDQVLVPVLCVNPSVDLVTLFADPATGRLRDNRTSTLTSGGWEPMTGDSVRFDGAAPPVGTITAPARTGGDWTVHTILGHWTIDLSDQRLVDQVQRLGSMYVMAFFRNDINALPHASDPMAALGAAAVGEPALLGRVALA